MNRHERTTPAGEEKCRRTGKTGMRTPPQDNIVPLLREQGPLHVDALGAALGRSPAELAPVLLGLEIMGRIRRLPGARYEAV